MNHAPMTIFPISTDRQDDDALRAAKGLLSGLAFSAPFWIVVLAWCLA